MRRFLAIFLLAVSGCSGANTPDCVFQFKQQVSGNVATVIGPFGSERKKNSDPYAPDFHWMRSDSTLDSLSGHQGQPVLLNFWATWCGPCKQEMPAVQSVANEMGDSVFVISVAVDNCGDAFSAVKSFVQDDKLTYQIAQDSNWYVYHQYWMYQPWALPLSIFIDANGNVRYSISGAGDKEAIKAYVRKTM